MSTEEDRVNVGVLVTIGAVGAISVLGISWAVTALVRTESDELMAEKGSTANLRPIQELRAEQQKGLETAGWVDKDAGIVSVPLDRARQLTLEGLKNDPESATAPGGDAGAAATDADAGGETTAREKAGDERAADKVGLPPDEKTAGGVTPDEATPPKPKKPKKPLPKAPAPPPASPGEAP